MAVEEDRNTPLGGSPSSSAHCANNKRQIRIDKSPPRSQSKFLSPSGSRKKPCYALHGFEIPKIIYLLIDILIGHLLSGLLMAGAKLPGRIWRRSFWHIRSAGRTGNNLCPGVV